MHVAEGEMIFFEQSDNRIYSWIFWEQRKGVFFPGIERPDRLFLIVNNYTL